MGFKLLILNPSEPGESAYVDTWPEKLRDTIPDIDVYLSKSVGEAMEARVIPLIPGNREGFQETCEVALKMPEGGRPGAPYSLRRNMS